jgi:hypothetical protein
MVAAAVLLSGCLSAPTPIDDGPLVPAATGEPRGDPSAFAFIRVDELTGQPARYNPCQPLNYVINPEGAPREDDVDLVHEAIASVAEATGIEFVYDGETDEPVTEDRPPYQPQRYGERWAPVLIGWTELNPPDTPSSDVHAAGRGGSIFAFSAGGRMAAVTGIVMVDVDSNRISRHRRTTVLLHELGHVMGLDHVDERHQIMAPVTETAKRSWGAGDLAGLRAVGAEAGCLPEIDPR